LVLIVGGIILQVFLSKRQSKWLGLILPCIVFMLSIVVVLNVAVGTAAYSQQKSMKVQFIAESGEIIISEQSEEPVEINDNFITGILGTVVVIFLLYNIPTVILLGIYFGVREKQRVRRSLDKMKLQDL
jgi:hypothetical protein